MQPDYNQASAYVHALTGQPADVAAIDLRMIHDSDKQRAAHHFRGTLPQLWQTVEQYQAAGYGCFINANVLDGVGRHLQNVQSIRAHVVDLDKVDAPAQLQMASNWNVPLSFASNTSPNKYHGYWIVAPYSGNEYYTQLQRKLRQYFNGDAAVIDASRVLRMPGTYNFKYSDPASDKYIPGSQPHLVTWWSLGSYGQMLPVEQLAATVEHVNVIDAGLHERKELGAADLAAPSFAWLQFGLSHINPNELSRGEWISITAAYKQAGWLLATEQQLFDDWSRWCAQYGANDLGENRKQWDSIRDTEVGWQSFKRRVPVLNAYEQFGFKDDNAPKPLPFNQPSPTPQPVEPQPSPTPPGDNLPPILSDLECKEYFANCFFIERMGLMLTPSGRFMNTTQFNGRYGGKLFVITPDGKTTDEPWKAATRSMLWTVPKVDHVRFLPLEPQFKLIEDQLGRLGVNTYIPVRIRSRRGDIMPFLRHMELMFPNETDRQIIYAYLAHNIKYPGFKIPWAPMIQSTEGVGKGFLIKCIERILGNMYVYRPKATELVKSGSTFNSWQRGKLMIVVDEIKVDEKRELIEILKPLITEDRAEIQSKGVDQDLEDNVANWVFFSNWKNAIPIYQNGRRFAVFYSVIQSKTDLLMRGMDDSYFNGLFMWLENGGDEIIADWLLGYPIDMGAIPRVAPETTSQAEAIRISRSPMELAIMNAINDGMPGFRNGYISSVAATARIKATGSRAPTQQTLHQILESLGYQDIGRADKQYGSESMSERSQIYAVSGVMTINNYARAQGYE